MGFLSFWAFFERFFLMPTLHSYLFYGASDGLLFIGAHTLASFLIVSLMLAAMFLLNLSDRFRNENLKNKRHLCNQRIERNNIFRNHIWKYFCIIKSRNWGRILKSILHTPFGVYRSILQIFLYSMKNLHWV